MRAKIDLQIIEALMLKMDLSAIQKIYTQPNFAEIFSSLIV